MFKAKFISRAVLPCEVAPAITEIAPKESSYTAFHETVVAQVGSA